jgi:hypothetical protein
MPGHGCVKTIVKLGVYEDALPFITSHQLARVSLCYFCLYYWSVIVSSALLTLTAGACQASFEKNVQSGAMRQQPARVSWWFGFLCFLEDDHRVAIVEFKLGVYEDALPYITSHQLARVRSAQQKVAVHIVGLYLRAVLCQNWQLVQFAVAVAACIWMSCGSSRPRGSRFEDPSCCMKMIVNFKLGVYEDALPYITSHQLARVSERAVTNLVN